jgi:hypothetical protein
MDHLVTALSTVDILLEVFGYIDARDSISPALVDSLWLDLFLNKIWWKLTTLDLVLQILFCRRMEGSGQVSIQAGGVVP